MKLMKRFLIAAVLLVAGGANAQETITDNNYDQGFRLGFGINAGGVTNDAFNFALGGDVRLQYDLSRDTSLTLTTGFTNLFAKENEFKDLGFIPVKAGFKAFINSSPFYVMGETGAGFAVTNGYDETTFIWSPGVGYANDFIDLSVRYEDVDAYYDSGIIALRLAYGFKL